MSDDTYREDYDECRVDVKKALCHDASVKQAFAKIKNMVYSSPIVTVPEFSVRLVAMYQPA